MAETLRQRIFHGLHKIWKIVNVEEENNPKVHEVIYVHYLGEGSLSEDLEELRKKDLTIPGYLTKLSSVLMFLNSWNGERRKSTQGIMVL